MPYLKGELQPYEIDARLLHLNIVGLYSDGERLFTVDKDGKSTPLPCHDRDRRALPPDGPSIGPDVPGGGAQ